MVRQIVINILISLVFLTFSGAALANSGNRGGGNPNQAFWMELARGYGWVKSRLSSQPRGPKDGKVRGLDSFRNAIQKPEPVKRPATKIKKSTSRIKEVKKTRKLAPKKTKSKSKAKSNTNLATLKPPPGVRQIRRLPTRIRTR